MKQQNIIIKITSSEKALAKVRTLVIKGEITHNDFDEHDTAARLFALEFAANNHSEIPMRVHISEAV